MPTVDEFSARELDNLPAPDDGLVDHHERRSPGLAFRVFASGRRSWYFRYRGGGKRRRLKIADYPDVGLAEARRRADRLRVETRDGADPVREREERLGSDTFGELVKAYLEDHAERNLAPRTVRELRRILLGSDLSDLRLLPAAEITDADVARALDPIERRSAMTQCNRTQSAISGVFTWAAPRRRAGVISNPAKALPRRHNERGGVKRYLTEDEIRDAFRVVDRRPDGVPAWAATALWMILATGQRPGEVVQARWTHIDLEAGTWEMPHGYRKRVRGQRDGAPPHDVPLSALVVERLRDLPGRRTGFLFPSSGKLGHKTTSALNQRIRRGVLRHADVERFTPHDLRRTCSTHLHGGWDMAGPGERYRVPRHVVSKILGHVDSSVAGVYDRHAYWEERREALELWGERLRDLVATDG